MKPITITLSRAEARGLLTCAEEGAEGLLHDAATRAVSIGNAAQVAACNRGLTKLRDAIHAPTPARRTAAE